MKEGWEIKKLGEVAVVSSGNSAPQKKELFENGIYPFIRTSDVGQIRKGFISSCVDYLNKDGIKGLKLYTKGTILFPKSGASTFLNHRVMLEIDSFVSSHLATIKGNNSITDDRFLLYFLTTIDARNLMQDIAYPSLKTSDISLISIPLPPLPEQQRIVSIIDKAFEAIDKAIENTQKNLQNAKELYHGYIKGVFETFDNDWEIKTLGDIGKPSMCKRILKHQTSGVGDIPFYKIGTFGKTPDAFIPKNIYNEFRTKYSFPKKGDILISASGTIGRRVRYDDEPAYFQDSNIVWIANNEKQVLNDYLYVFYEFCDWKPSKGATISRLYNSDLTSIKIRFPKSLDDQKELIGKINLVLTETQTIESKYQAKLLDLEELKKSILNKAFAGEL